ncbi:two pore calcium channel protein 2-like [Anneissia japonica]|uniref:two pore calcium channel protein 2-like n=1 Tax=Anneissia japonica TaxID=1529436 RepID=UPI00142591DE|nr:two pore calcium channel protein 2-like [Anneissia japonica]
MTSEDSTGAAYNILTNSMYSSAEFEHELLSGRDDLSSENCKPEALLQAVVFVEDAVQFRSIYHKVDIKSLWYYRLYYSPIVQWIISSAICVILLLAFFEFPSSLTTGWSSDPRYRKERIEAPCGLTESIELVCLLIFVADIWMKAYLIGNKQFMKQKWLFAYVLVIVASLIDWIVSVHTACNEIIRFRRLLRPFFLLQNSSLMKKTVRSIKRTLPEVFSVILLVVLHLYFFTMVGIIIFSAQTSSSSVGNSTDTDNGNKTNEDKFFSSIGRGYRSLLVLLTTANNPDVMMPAYIENRMYALFFIIFLSIGLYCFFNMLTAVIYNQFRGYLQSSMQASFFRRRLGIRAAFEIMRRQGKISFTVRQIRNTVPVSMVKSVILQVKMKKVFKTAIIRELDDKMGGFVTSIDFCHLFDVLDKNLKVKKVKLNMLFCPFLRKVQSCISHRYFTYFGSFIAVINVICITIEMGLEKKEEKKAGLIAAMNFLFIIYYIVELILKIWILGWRKYFSSKLNIADFAVVISLFVIEVAYASSIGKPFAITESLGESYDLFVLSRIINLLILVRLFRIITHIKPMAIVAWTTVDLIKNLRAFAGILVVIYYFFAILGIQLFYDKITYEKRDPERMRKCGTYEQLNYWANNFDDFAAALVVLWDVMVVNNWHIFLDAYAEYTNKWYQIYFICWYFVSVLVCLNLFAALIIENFITKWDRYHLQEREDQQTMYMLNVHAMFRPDLKEPSDDDLMNALQSHQHLNIN